MSRTRRRFFMAKNAKCLKSQIFCKFCKFWIDHLYAFTLLRFNASLFDSIFLHRNFVSTGVEGLRQKRCENLFDLKKNFRQAFFPSFFFGEMKILRRVVCSFILMCGYVGTEGFGCGFFEDRASGDIAAFDTVLPLVTFHSCLLLLLLLYPVTVAVVGAPWATASIVFFHFWRSIE